MKLGMNLPEDLEVEYVAAFIADPAALFAEAMRTFAWNDRMRARKTASFGRAYNYSGNSYPTTEVPELLQPVICDIERVVGHTINNCLANLYDDGESSMGFHSDSAEGVVPGTSTSIVSLGAPRSLLFRRSSDRGTEWPIQLAPGSLLAMKASVQTDWQHGIRPSPGTGARISLTFRHLVAA
ncbi:MAG: alpha-ketoglutarate-dependent dioxygenase AlkB [Deltaproteobacteria bacterium]